MAQYDDLARAILRAQTIREESYRRTGPVEYAGHLHPTGRYTKTYDQASEEAAPGDPQTQRLVTLLNVGAWNDAHDWAMNQLGHSP